MTKSMLAPHLAGDLSGRSATSPETISNSDARRLSVVRVGTVFSVRDVTVDGSRQGDGNSAGPIVGVLAGGAVLSF